MRQLYYTLLLFAASAPVALFAQGDDKKLTYKLENPLKFDTLEGLLVGILNVLLIIAVPIIVFFLIFAGFSYVTAQGNPEKIKQASRALTYAIIGGVLILGAVAISEILQNVVESFSTEGNSIVDTAPVTSDGRGSAGGG
jgi:uncharacterized RDD family membrane protein YckC